MCPVFMSKIFKQRRKMRVNNCVIVTLVVWVKENLNYVKCILLTYFVRLLATLFLSPLYGWCIANMA